MTRPRRAPAPPTPDAPPLWLFAIVAVARRVIPKTWCGRIEINAFQGGVSNANVLQTFKFPEDPPK